MLRIKLLFYFFKLNFIKINIIKKIIYNNKLK